MSKVLVMESTYDTCHEAVEQAFSNFPIDIAGKKVAIKTNALKASDPDQQAMATHYKLVKAVVEEGRNLQALQYCRRRFRGDGILRKFGIRISDFAPEGGGGSLLPESQQAHDRRADAGTF